MINKSHPSSTFASDTTLLNTIESAVTVATSFLVLVIIFQDIIILSTIKIRSSPVSLLFISLCISDLILVIQSSISLIKKVPTASEILSIASSLSVLSLIAMDKAVSLARPFIYSNIVTQATVSRVLVPMWIISMTFSVSLSITRVPQDCENSSDSPPHPLFFAFLSIITFLLLISIGCHLCTYLYIFMLWWVWLCSVPPTSLIVTMWCN